MRYFLVLILLFNFLSAEKYDYEALIKDLVHNYDKAIELAKQKNKYVLALVSTTGCPFCERTKRYVLTNEKVLEIINSHYVFVNFERPEVKTYPNFLYSEFCPTFHIINPQNNDIIYQVMGYKTPKAVIKEISMENIKGIEEL